jgi:hypothetical protein
MDTGKKKYFTREKTYIIKMNFAARALILQFFQYLCDHLNYIRSLSQIEHDLYSMVLESMVINTSNKRMERPPICIFSMIKLRVS